MTSDATARSNLLENSGFETGSGTQPDGWTARLADATLAHTALEWAPGFSRTGDRGVSVLVRSTHPDSPHFYGWSQNTTGCVPGETYELSGWMRAENLHGSAELVAESLGSGTNLVLDRISTQTEKMVTGVTGWIYVRVTFIVPDGTQEVRVTAGLSTPENIGGQALFDDIFLIPQ